jgi:predicted transcriptional regulator
VNLILTFSSVSAARVDSAQLSCYLFLQIQPWEKRSKLMANITLKIDDELLKKARHLAVQKKTSINAIVKEKLNEFVSRDLRRESTLKGLEAFYRKSNARVGDKNWTRDEIYER